MTRRICFLAIMAVLLLTGAGRLSAEGLTIRIENSPRLVKAGRDLGPSFRLVATNKGDAAVKDAAVEIVLKKDALCPAPPRHAVYSPNYFDGVLLSGGRESLSVAPGQTVTLHLHGKNTIPWDTPVGRTYCLCAVVITDEKAETGVREGGCACSPVKVVGVEERPVVTGYAETCLTRRGTVTILGRNFGPAAGKAVILGGGGLSISLPPVSWGDSMIIARVPDDLSIRDGERYFIAVRDAETAQWLSNTDSYISACAAQGPAPPSRPQPPPAPPFFH